MPLPKDGLSIGKGRKIYETDGLFVISEHSTWRPGVFRDQQAAEFAFSLTDEDIDELMDEHLPVVRNGGLTLEQVTAQYTTSIQRRLAEYKPEPFSEDVLKCAASVEQTILLGPTI